MDNGLPIFNGVPNFSSQIETPFSKAEMDANPKIENTPHSPDGFDVKFVDYITAFAGDEHLQKIVGAVSLKELRPGAAFYSPAHDSRLKGKPEKQKMVAERLIERADKYPMYLRVFDVDAIPVTMSRKELREMREKAKKEATK